LIQRFGSALNLNIHFHMLFLDGVYVDSAGSSAYDFLVIDISVHVLSAFREFGVSNPTVMPVYRVKDA